MKLIFASLLLVVLVAVGAGLLLLSRQDAHDAVIQAELAGARFVYARAYARDEVTAAGGLSDRLSFIAAFPGFSPLAARDRAAKNRVALTITPKDDTLDPAERPARLYARFLTPETKDGPGGLVLRDFEPASPYDFERLYVAPPDGRAFFARCPKSENGAPDEGCLTVFRTGGVDVELRYAPELLEQWDALIDGARNFVARLTAPPGRKKRG